METHVDTDFVVADKLNVTELSQEGLEAFSAALDEATLAAHSALRQSQRNLLHLRDARLEVETARDIVAASNQRAALLAGAVE